MDEEDDDSIYMIPDNHPLVVISDEETTEEIHVKLEATNHNKPVVKKEKTDERNLKRKKEVKREVNKKKIKIEKFEENECSSQVDTKNGVKSEDFSSLEIKEEKLKVKKENLKIEKENLKLKKENSMIKKEGSKNKSEKPQIKQERSKLPESINFNSTALASTAEENTPPKLGSGINWEAEMLVREANIPLSIAKNIVTMLRNDYTVPFMARYRRNATGNMDADELRRIKDSYQHIKILETKALSAMRQIKAAEKLTPKLEEMIYGVKSLDELEFIYAPYKKGSSKSKAERARALGLESAAIEFLEGRQSVNVDELVDPTKKGLQSQNEVIEAIQNIIADIFAKDEEMLAYLSNIEKNIHVMIKSSQIKSSEDKAGTKEKGKKPNEDVGKKFELYYNFTVNANNVQSHQILALNRGENLKILSVKYIINEWLERKLYNFFEKKWIRGNFRYPLREKIFKTSFHDSYTRLISPFVIRRTKSALNRRAQYDAIESFAQNLKNLLQAPPVRGCSILGVDPGFRHGSKFALISQHGEVLWTEVLNFGTGYTFGSDEKYMRVVRQQLVQHKCEVIAIGNGTGCRNIENIFGAYIKRGFFKPEINVQYTIVNERGASIYSCSGVAKEEFPNLDPNLVSAVFIARTLQDPLSEFVKVDPKHLGVGMYQHDMPEKQLSNALDDVVEQCVSFVGVDLNTASIHLLTRISGLGPVRAKNIIEWRQENSLFKNRQQLLKVKGIGSKTFEQCSGFVRIYPSSVDTPEKKKKLPTKSKASAEQNNPLDRTCIHPESYALAEKFLEKCELDPAEIGTQSFIERVRSVVSEEGIENIATELDPFMLTDTISKMSLIVDALMQPIGYDYRNQFSKPIFRQGLEDINTLTVGTEMMGAVGNVTSFGAFVDIGVGPNGLIHTSGMNGQRVEVGDRVEVRILDVQPERNRISLLLLRKC